MYIESFYVKDTTHIYITTISYTITLVHFCQLLIHIFMNLCIFPKNALYMIVSHLLLWIQQPLKKAVISQFHDILFCFCHSPVIYLSQYIHCPFCHSFMMQTIAFFSKGSLACQNICDLCDIHLMIILIGIPCCINLFIFKFFFCDRCF